MQFDSTTYRRRLLYPIIWVFSVYKTLNAIHDAIHDIHTAPELLRTAPGQLRTLLVFAVAMMWSLGHGFYAALLGAILGLVLAFFLMLGIGWLVVGMTWIYHFYLKLTGRKINPDTVVALILPMRLFSGFRNYSPEFGVSNFITVVTALCAVGAFASAIRDSLTPTSPPSDFQVYHLVFYIPGLGLLAVCIYLWPHMEEWISNLVRWASGKSKKGGTTPQTEKSSASQSKGA